MKTSSPWKPTDNKRGQYVGMPCKNIDNLSVSISNGIGVDNDKLMQVSILSPQEATEGQMNGRNPWIAHLFTVPSK